MPTTEINKSKNPHETNRPRNKLTKPRNKLTKLSKLLKPVNAFFKWIIPNKNSIKKNPEQIFRNATINPFYPRDKKPQEPVRQPWLPSSRSIHLGVYNSSDINILRELQQTRK